MISVRSPRRSPRESAAGRPVGVGGVRSVGFSNDVQRPPEAAVGGGPVAESLLDVGERFEVDRYIPDR